MTTVADRVYRLLESLGSATSVVISRKIIPFFGKSGMSRILPLRYSSIVGLFEFDEELAIKPLEFLPFYLESAYVRPPRPLPECRQESRNIAFQTFDFNFDIPRIEIPDVTSNREIPRCRSSEIAESDSLYLPRYQDFRTDGFTRLVIF